MTAASLAVIFPSVTAILGAIQWLTEGAVRNYWGSNIPCFWRGAKELARVSSPHDGKVFKHIQTRQLWLFEPGAFLNVFESFGVPAGCCLWTMVNPRLSDFFFGDHQDSKDCEHCNRLWFRAMDLHHAHGHDLHLEALELTEFSSVKCSIFRTWLKGFTMKTMKHWVNLNPIMHYPQNQYRHGYKWVNIPSEW